MASINKFITSILISILRFYQYVLGALLGPCCRFEPSCSAYAIAAIQTHDCLTGCFLMIRRLLRCHPWCAGGKDEVPHLTKSQR